MCQPLAIRARNLVVCQGKKEIINGFNYELAAGVIEAIIGDNGAGKSTVARTFGALRGPKFSGQLELLGQPVDCRATDADRARQRLRIGQLLQTAPVQANLTVYENLEAVAIVRGVSGWRRRQEVYATLERFEFAHRAREQAGKLNGGGKALLSLAAAVMGLPPRSLIIADEPTAALSLETREALLEALLDLNRLDGHAILVFTHDLGWLGALTRDVWELRDGSLTRVSTTSPPPVIVEEPVDAIVIDVASDEADKAREDSDAEAFDEAVSQWLSTTMC